MFLLFRGYIYMYQCDFLFFYSTEKKCVMNKCKKKSVCFHHDFDIEVMLLIIICKKKKKWNVLFIYGYIGQGNFLNYNIGRGCKTLNTETLWILKIIKADEFLFFFLFISGNYFCVKYECNTFSIFFRTDV